MSYLVAEGVINGPATNMVDTDSFDADRSEGIQQLQKKERSSMEHDRSFAFCQSAQTRIPQFPSIDTMLNSRQVLARLI